MRITTIIILAILANIWILTRPKPLGNINYSAAKPATNNSNILFPGKTGEKIKFSFESAIKSGNLDIELTDSICSWLDYDERWKNVKIKRKCCI